MEDAGIEIIYEKNTKTGSPFKITGFLLGKCP